MRSLTLPPDINAGAVIGLIPLKTIWAKRTVDLSAPLDDDHPGLGIADLGDRVLPEVPEERQASVLGIEQETEIRRQPTEGIAVTRPPSVAMTSTVATTSVFPTST